ncbi:unnamed protein product [Coccothraustes coccothraustes]
MSGAETPAARDQVVRLPPRGKSYREVSHQHGKAPPLSLGTECPLLKPACRARDRRASRTPGPEQREGSRGPRRDTSAARAASSESQAALVQVCLSPDT